MKLGSILNEDLIFDVSGSNRQDIYTALLQKAAEKVTLPAPVEELVSATMKAENLCIGLEYGPVAMPHLRRNDFADLYLIIGRVSEPVKMLGDDTKESSLVMFSLISPATSDMYLKSISAFTRYALQESNIDKLLATRNGQEFIDVLNRDDVYVKRSLTAEDVMTPAGVTLSPNDGLDKALDILNSTRRRVIPVVDDNGVLVGELDSKEMIKSVIPKYLFMLENTDFLVNFEPFERIFQMEHTQLVSEIMQPPKMKIDPQLPLIRITIDLVERTAVMFFIVDVAGKLKGEISINNIIHKVLRG